MLDECERGGAMAQLTVYIDDSTRKRIERAAKRANVSVSQWVKEKLTNALTHDWPEGYFALLGSLADEQLERPEELPRDDDALREPL
jgi:hypothetical protein